MKRYFLGILTVIFIISLTACGRNSNNTGQTATQPNSVEDITASLPENCTVEENVLGIYRPEVSQSQQSVLKWLNDIGYTSQSKEDNSDMTNEITNRQIRVQDDNGNTVVFELNESAAALDLYNQLPLTVEVENYSNNEKIFYPDELDVTDTPAANTGAGTLAYYAPWGDVVMFYGDYNANSSLYELGHAVTGAEYISRLSGYIKIEPV